MVNTFVAWAFAIVASAPFAAPQRAQAAGSQVRSAPAVASPSSPRTIVLARIDALRPGDATFKTVYGNAISLSGEARLRAARRIYVGLEAGYLKETGALSVTQESTTLTLYPVTGALVVYLASGTISPWGGGGATVCKFSERNVIGNVSGTGVGPMAAGGVTLHIGRAAVDARIKYNSIKVKPAEEQANLGGLMVGIAAGVKF